MFERYTEKARRTIYFARHEASQFGSPRIESEHVLLGLLRESKALCAKLLANSPATTDSIRKQIEKHTTFGEKIPTSVDLPITEECRRILTIPDPHLRSWIQALISLSDDGQTLYANIGIEKAVPNGAVVHYHLARLELTDKKLELLCHLKDIRF